MVPIQSNNALATGEEKMKAINLQSAINRLGEARDSLYEEAGKLAFGVNPELAAKLYAQADAIVAQIKSLQEIDESLDAGSVAQEFDLDDLALVTE